MLLTSLPWMLIGVPPSCGAAMIGLLPPPQRRRSQPFPTVVVVTGVALELQPTKTRVPSFSSMLKRGAPAPQCEPLASAAERGLRRS